MMTDEQKAAIKAEIANVGNMIQSTVGTLDPALLPVLALGKAVAVAFPDLVQDAEIIIAKLTSGETTDSENSALAEKIGSLFTPENL